MKPKKYAELPERSHPDYNKLYRKLNSEKLKQKRKEKYELNRDKIRQKERENYDPVRAAKYRSKNRKRFREHNWKRHGIVDFTYEQYLIELTNQNSCCKICGNTMTMPQVDHDHNTGKYRALLCKPCNFGLGTYEKNKEVFEQYLIEHGIK